MSVADEITKLRNNMSSAYTAVEEKGGTLPEEQTMSGLADSITSIPSGGGGGTFVVDVKAMELQMGVVSGNASSTINIPADSDIDSFYVDAWGCGTPKKFTGGAPVNINVTLGNGTYTFSLPHTLRAASQGSMTDFQEETAYEAECMNQINFKTGKYINWWADTNIDWSSARDLASDTTFNCYKPVWESIPGDNQNVLMSFVVDSTLSGWRIPVGDLGIVGAMDYDVNTFTPTPVSSSQGLDTWVQRIVPTSRLNYSVADSRLIQGSWIDGTMINGAEYINNMVKIRMYIENGYLYIASTDSLTKSQVFDLFEELNLQLEYALKVPTETVLPSTLTEYVNENIIGHHNSAVTLSYSCNDASPVAENRGDGHYVKGTATKTIDDYNIANTNNVWDIEMWYMEHGLDIYQDGVLWLQPKEVE